MVGMFGRMPLGAVFAHFCFSRWRCAVIIEGRIVRMSRAGSRVTVEVADNTMSKGTLVLQSWPAWGSQDGFPDVSIGDSIRAVCYGVQVWRGGVWFMCKHADVMPVGEGARDG